MFAASRPLTAGWKTTAPPRAFTAASTALRSGTLAWAARQSTRRRRQLAQDLHEPLGRVGTAPLGGPGQLGRITEQQRPLRIEERHLGDRVAEFGEFPGAFEHLDVELRRAGTITPRLD